ncbi:transposase domain-containing protein [Escherichia coli]
MLYSLIGTCRLNNVEPEKWLRYVIEHIQDWPANRVRDLLPWKVDSDLSVNINTVLASRLPGYRRAGQ